MITSASRRSRRYPYVAAPEAPNPTEAGSACSEFLAPDDKPARRWIDRALDFAACCVLAVVMALMEERKHAGRIEPWKAQLLIAKAVAWSAILLGLMAFVLWKTKP